MCSIGQPKTHVLQQGMVLHSMYNSVDLLVTALMFSASGTKQQPLQTTRSPCNTSWMLKPKLQYIYTCDVNRTMLITCDVKCIMLSSYNSPEPLAFLQMQLSSGLAFGGKSQT